ncbi:hypothetical protein JCM10449v2_007995 [Rhodotorula kratochvilovae]
MHYPSTSSFTVALVASAALLASQAEALPTHRSTSTIARRAHIASHHQHAARAIPSSDDAATTLGDHSIVVDASTSSAGSSGGIKNSTINLTSISKRTREGTLASFSRVVRSLFGRAVPPAPEVFHALPLTYSPPVASSSSSAAAHKKRRGAGHKKRRTVKKPRAGAPLKGNTRTLPSGLVLELPDAYDHKHVANVKRKRALELRAENERRAMNYTLGQAQASAYHAAVAALGDGLPTAEPVPNAKAVAPTAAFANETAPLSSTFVVLEAEPVATASPSPSADVAAAISPAALEPVTLTITLVPSGVNGALIDAAALPTATASPIPALAAPSSSSITANPKASAFASLAAVSAYVPPSATSASAGASQEEAPIPVSAALSAVKRGMERRTVAAKRAPDARAAAVKAAVKPAQKWYPA